ncbi:unnamed protein product [Vitrella brassicaformis CCMP3155]|uniref:Uncharacterized protein n=1 Tax=Vitrella brassicaformis (strain CCMP3155) TaxID=1169540 RepID=A0A0G4GVD8_VITBC|nr:unnamed protein product [Vitrella brassicaformis CCMP3155]|eukprot:CEM34709.1 unnamed protein product [Vitrella brassicaformis CCMP3155]
MNLHEYLTKQNAQWLSESKQGPNAAQIRYSKAVLHQPATLALLFPPDLHDDAPPSFALRSLADKNRRRLITRTLEENVALASLHRSQLRVAIYIMMAMELHESSEELVSTFSDRLESTYLQAGESDEYLKDVIAALLNFV